MIFECSRSLGLLPKIQTWFRTIVEVKLGEIRLKPRRIVAQHRQEDGRQLRGVTTVGIACETILSTGITKMASGKMSTHCTAENTNIKMLTKLITSSHHMCMFLAIARILRQKPNNLSDTDAEDNLDVAEWNTLQDTPCQKMTEMPAERPRQKLAPETP